MVRIPTIALLLVVCTGFAGCQSYTTGLQKTAESANDPAAIMALRSIATAQRTYAATHAGNYGTFQQLHDASYLDSRFNASQPEIAGYVFSMLTQKTEGEPSRFACNADPVQPGGGRHFYMDSSSTLIRVNPGRPATAADGPIGE